MSKNLKKKKKNKLSNLHFITLHFKNRFLYMQSQSCFISLLAKSYNMRKTVYPSFTNVNKQMKQTINGCHSNSVTLLHQNCF